MSEPSQREDSLLPLPLGQRVDRVSNEFEVAWRGTTAPRIEDFLVGWEGRELSALLRHLRMAIKPRFVQLNRTLI